MQCEEIIAELKQLGSPENVAGMRRFGINAPHLLGVSVPNMRRLAKRAGKDHQLAQRLWKTGLHEARIMACLVDDLAAVTEAQMERWVRDFDSWDICDLCCGNLFDRTPWAYPKAVEWSARAEEFVKRAGFALMAALAVHDKAAADDVFQQFFPIIEREAGDDRNFVRKAVNWALRQIGKRNSRLRPQAITVAERIRAMDSKSARWIAADALRELRRYHDRR